MKDDDAMKQDRRTFLQAAGTGFAGFAVGALPWALHDADGASRGLRIGVIGSGNVGSTVGKLWVKAGHEVMFSSLDYNEVGCARMRDDAHRAGERLGIPIAGDDAQAMKTAVRLVRDAGHEPVVGGGLARAREFDYGTPVFGKPLTAAELRKALGLLP